MQKTYTIYDQKGENQYPIYDKTAEKSHIREYTQGDEPPVDQFWCVRLDWVLQLHLIASLGTALALRSQLMTINWKCLPLSIVEDLYVK